MKEFASPSYELDLVNHELARINYIYGLADPLSGVVRYVGKSFDPVKRMNGHLRIKKPKTYKEKWISSILKAGLLPELVILEATTKNAASEREIFWIAKYLSEGVRLTNGTAGGDGFGDYWLGKTHSPETKRKISILRTGKKFSEAAKAKMSQSQKGRKGLVGYKHSEATRAKMSAAQLGRIVSDETREKLSARLKVAWALRKA